MLRNIHKVLESVDEFKKEGDILKHCVYVNKYYNRADSLVLSARIDDKPIETIEVSLSSLKIVQSRGLKNNMTEHHETIVSIVNRNLNAIKRLIEKQA